MEYRDGKKEPVTSDKRRQRRHQQRRAKNREEEANRQRSQGGGEPNELGVTQGQNGEQGNSFDPEKSKSIGRTSQP